MSVYVCVCPCVVGGRGSERQGGDGGRGSGIMLDELQLKFFLLSSYTLSMEASSSTVF